jgi:hypothetical protein
MTNSKKGRKAKAEPPKAAEPQPPSPEACRAEPPSRRAVPLQLTNLKKVFWPAEGYTKGDQSSTHRGVSPWLLPLSARQAGRAHPLSRRDRGKVVLSEGCARLHTGLIRRS